VAALCNTTYRLRELMPILKPAKLDKSGQSDQDHQYYYPLLVNATTSAVHNNLKNENTESNFNIGNVIQMFTRLPGTPHQRI